MQTLSSAGKLEQTPLFSIPKQVKNISWRTPFIDEIISFVNEERRGTDYLPIAAKLVALKTSHLKTAQDFSYIISISKDVKRRGGSFSKTFFGSIKPRKQG